MDSKDMEMAEEKQEKIWTDKQSGSETADPENEVDEITALKSELEKSQQESQKHFRGLNLEIRAMPISIPRGRASIRVRKNNFRVTVNPLSMDGSNIRT
jgi:hypothetical protein